MTNQLEKILVELQELQMSTFAGMYPEIQNLCINLWIDPNNETVIACHIRMSKDALCTNANLHFSFAEGKDNEAVMRVMREAIGANSVLTSVLRKSIKDL